jgi:curved DNA-binding protein CbpA
MKDLYVILQVARTAIPEEIHGAYRRRALELHPDRSGASSEPFLELQRAYSVLSDPAQRAAYDRKASSVPPERVGVRRRPAEPFRQAEPFDDGREERSAFWFRPGCDATDVAAAEKSVGSVAGAARVRGAWSLRSLWTSPTQPDSAGSMSCRCGWMSRAIEAFT